MEIPTAATRLIALLGDPVAHSLSPRIQNAAFRAAGVDGVYLALRCNGEALAGLLHGLVGAVGGGNITVPHKERAVALLDSATGAVTRTGACNTFWPEAGRLCGDNTDVVGFGEAVRTLIGAPAGARVLVLGAGGAARAAVCALLDGGVDAVLVLNRSRGRAEAMRRALDRSGPAGSRVHVAGDAGRLRHEAFDLVVNATPLGLDPEDPLPLELGSLGGAGAALDLVYSAAETAWVHAARALGIPAADGTDMLIHQGAAAFRRWWPAPAPIAAMRQAVPSRHTPSAGPTDGIEARSPVNPPRPGS